LLGVTNPSTIPVPDAGDLVVAVVSAVAGSAVFASEGPLRVATSAAAPFVLPDANPPAGFSIDLWREVAAPHSGRIHMARCSRAGTSGI